MAVNVTWKPSLVLHHDPDDIADIELDMTAVVGTGDTLDSVDVDASGVTAVLQTFDAAGVIVFRVSGGTAGEAGSVTVQATMGSGRKQSRTITFTVFER